MHPFAPRRPALDVDPALAALRERAADGSPEARFDLACALVGRGLYEEGLEMYRRAAQHGHSGAQVEYARMLMWGIACDATPAAAVPWLERSEAAGNVAAGYYLAMLTLGSVVLPRDGRINERIYKAVRGDFPPALRAAAVHFGRKSTPADQALCLRLLSRATNLGDPVCAKLLAERLMRGEGGDVQPRASRQLRQQLAARGHLPLPPIVAPLPPVLPMPHGAPESEPAMLALEDALQPAPLDVLSESPRVMHIDQLLSADECRLLVACTQPVSRPPPPVPGVAPDVLAAAPPRTIDGLRFEPMVEDLALRLIALRLARSARMELSQAEDLVVRVEHPGDKEPVQRDGLDEAALATDRPQAGNRVRTVIACLNNVEAGGDIGFPDAGLRIAPRTGRVVLFDNLLPDGRPDPRARRVGLPVTRGEKWLAVLRLRERRYRPY